MDNTTEPTKPEKQQSGKKKEKPFNPAKPLKNIKHEIYANMLIKTKGNQSQAYQDTYGQKTKKHSRISASQLLTKPNVHQRVEYLLRTHNQLNIDNTLEVLATQMTATKPVIADKQVEMYPDNGAILSAVTTNLKLHGLLKQDNSVHIDNRQQSVIAGSPEEVNAVIDRLIKLNEAYKMSDMPSGVIDVT